MAESITIKENPNSVPLGRWEIRYGSRKIYSDIIKRGINIPTKIAAAKMMYL